MATESETKFQNIRNDIVKASFKNLAGSEEEFIDILNEYCWRNTTSYGKSSIENKVKSITSYIPFCYVIEHKQNIAPYLCNLFNSLYTYKYVAEQANNLKSQILSNSNIVSNARNITESDLFKSLTSSYTALKESLGSSGIISSLDDYYKKLEAKISLNKSLNTYLEPYKYMYGTTLTKKYFTFPMFEDSSKIEISNQWGDTDEKDSANKFINNFAQKSDYGPNKMSNALETIGIISNIINTFRTDDKYSNYSFTKPENSKAYMYPSNGESSTVSFVLYNTIKTNAWKDNYRFILLFILRNMPLKVTLNEYIPPLLYEFIVPGVKVYPLCYVSSFKAEPLGMIRMMKVDDVFSNITINNEKLSKIGSAAIPEAWKIDITFQSMIAPSANLMLSSMLGDKITVGTTINNGENQ